MVYCIKRREDLLIDSWCKKTINIEQKSLWKSRPLFKSRPSDRFKSLTSFEWKKKRQARPFLSAPPLACRVSWTHIFPLPSGNGLALRTFLSPAWTAATFLRPRARRCWRRVNKTWKLWPAYIWTVTQKSAYEWRMGWCCWCVRHTKKRTTQRTNAFFTQKLRSCWNGMVQ